jgi:hypothetical protein
MTPKILSLKRTAALLIVGGALLLSTKAFGMFKVCLFSPVKGIVVQKGQPVVGAVIERTWEFGKKHSDQTVTDSKGEFTMPGVYSMNLLVKYLPAEVNIMQEINIHHSGQSWLAWCHFKSGFEEFDELQISEFRGDGPGLKGKPINLYCDLDKKVVNYGGVGGYGGIAELR